MAPNTKSAPNTDPPKLNAAAYGAFIPGAYDRVRTYDGIEAAMSHPPTPCHAIRVPITHTSQMMRASETRTPESTALANKLAYRLLAAEDLPPLIRIKACIVRTMTRYDDFLERAQECVELSEQVKFRNDPTGDVKKALLGHCYAVLTCAEAIALYLAQQEAERGVAQAGGEMD